MTLLHSVFLNFLFLYNFTLVLFVFTSFLYRFIYSIQSKTNPIVTTIINGANADVVDFVDITFILDKIVFNKKNILRKLFIRFIIDKGIKVIL